MSFPQAVVDLRRRVVMRLDLGLQGAQILDETRRTAEALCGDPEQVEAVLDDLFGLGPLEALLRDHTVRVVHLDEALRLWADRGTGPELVERGFADVAHANRLLTRWTHGTGSTPDADGTFTFAGPSGVQVRGRVGDRPLLRVERP